MNVFVLIRSCFFAFCFHIAFDIDWGSTLAPWWLHFGSILAFIIRYFRHRFLIVFKEALETQLEASEEQLGAPRLGG